MQETLPQPFLQHFWGPSQLESVLHWFMQTPSTGIPGLRGGQVPGFSAKGKRPETCRPWHEGQGRLCSSWSCGHGPSPSCHRGKVPVPAAASPPHSSTYWRFHQPDSMGTCWGHHMA